MKTLNKHNFAIKYFGTYFNNNNYIHVKTREVLNMNILNDFYEDFVTSKLNFNQYKKQTQVELY